MNRSDFFDFNFETDNRETLLKEAYETVNAGLLGGALTDTPKSPAQLQADELLNRLNQQLASFAAYPEVYPFNQESYTKYGLSVPPMLETMLQEYRLYWVHFPIILHRLEDRSFQKIEVGVEFNPGETNNRLRPRALTILPDQKFRDRLSTTGEAKLGLGANLEFDVQTGSLQPPLPVGSLNVGAGVTVENAAKLGLVVFPFEYKLRAAEIENSAARAEQVYWRVSGGKFFQDNRPEFVVILQVPRQTTTVKIGAALQAYSEVKLSDRLMRLFRPNVKKYLEAGAPIPATKTPDDWDITQQLQEAENQ